MRTIFSKIENNDIKGVKEQLIQGFDINEKDDFGQTPLHSAVNYESLEIIELLITEGADVNGTDEEGESSIFMISSDNIKLFELLLVYGADPNIKNNDGRTILDKAYEENLTDVIELLQSYGAQSTIKPNDY